MNIHFGTGGWRAEIGKDFCMDNVRLIAAGLLKMMKKHKRTGKPVVIGYDRRFLSDSAAVWLAEVLCAGGIKVLMVHRSAPTPLIMHTVQKMGLDYGLEVTASHNPPVYNGVKLIVKEGRDASVEVTDELESCIAAITEAPKTKNFEQCLSEGIAEYIKNPFNGFLDDILAVLDTAAIRERGLRILFDPMHGSATYPLMTIFYTTRCTVDIIHSNKDAYFGGHMPAPEEDTLGELAKRVVDGGYDLGIGVDGDGDRLGIIDSNGEYITANEILVLLYYYLHEYKGWKGPVVRNLATSHMLDAIAEDFGETAYEVPVGFKYISSKIDEADAVLGGESSGGLTVRGHIHGKDSVYAASLFVEMICKTGRTPSAMLKKLRKKYGNFVMVEDNVRFDPDRKDSLINIIYKNKSIPEFAAGIKSVSYLDGCKIYFESGGFVICRFSGTEPLLRIFAESDNADTARSFIAAWKEFLKL